MNELRDVGGMEREGAPERGPGGSGPDGRSLPMAGQGGAQAPDAHEMPPAPPAFRLLGTLGIAGAMAGLLLVLVNQWTEPRIEAHRAMVLEAAIHEVLGGPDRYETLFLVDGNHGQLR